LLLAIVSLGVAFSAFAGVSRKETLSGYLAPVGGGVRVIAPRTGTLSRISVVPGRWVEAGAPLFLIQTAADLEGGGTLTASRAAAISGQIDALRRQLAAEDGSMTLEAAQAQARLTGLQKEAASIREQVAAQGARIASSVERLKSITPIRAKGFVSEDEVRNREEHLLSLRQGMSALQRQLAENEREQDRASIEARQAPASLIERKAVLHAQLAELKGRRVESDATGAQLIRAPVAGRIVALRAERGQAVSGGTPLLTIAPGEPRLQAILFAGPAVVGLIKKGQPVRVMYDAFPVARFGAQQGVVREISPAAVSSDDSKGPNRYRVEVDIERQGVDAAGAEAPLQPDMSVKADVILEKRSLLEWILQPLLTARARR
jgi:membrane fusion protein